MPRQFCLESSGQSGQEPGDISQDCFAIGAETSFVFLIFGAWSMTSQRVSECTTRCAQTCSVSTPWELTTSPIWEEWSVSRCWRDGPKRSVRPTRSTLTEKPNDWSAELFGGRGDDGVAVEGGGACGRTQNGTYTGAL